MKVTVPQKELAAAVTQARRAVSNRATLPVLGGVRISANGNVNVAASDLETTILARIDAAADVSGDVVVPAAMLEKITKKMSGDIRLSAENGELEITGARGSFRIKAMAREDYPALPVDTFTGEGFYSFPGPVLTGALEQALAAASKDESRQVLTGILLEVSELGEATFTATDSYRLASHTITAGGRGTFKGILPARIARETIRLAKKAETVSLATGPDYVSITVGNITIGSRLIDGEFPNWRQLVPQGAPNTLTVDRDAFLETLDRVGLMAQNNLPVKLELATGYYAGDSTITLSAHTPDIGEASETLEGADYRGESLVTAFNPAFLAEGVSSYSSSRVSFEITDGLKPALIHAEDEGPDWGHLYLLMPVRLS